MQGCGCPHLDSQRWFVERAAALRPDSGKVKQTTQYSHIGRHVKRAGVCGLTCIPQGQGEATQSWEGVLLSFQLAFGYIPNSSNLYFLGPLADSTSATESTDRRLVVFTPPSHPRQPQLLEAAGVPVSVVSSHSEVSTSLRLPVSRQPHHGLLFSIIYLTHTGSPAADSCFSDREEFCDAGDPSAVGSGVY